MRAGRLAAGATAAALRARGGDAEVGGLACGGGGAAEELGALRDAQQGDGVQ